MDGAGAWGSRRRMRAMIEQQARGMPFRFDLREASGALADLGTLLPLLLGCIAVGGVAMLPAVLGFAVFYVATGLYYRLPIPVQPMKAVAAVVLRSEERRVGKEGRPRAHS